MVQVPWPDLVAVGTRTYAQVEKKLHAELKKAKPFSAFVPKLREDEEDPPRNQDAFFLKKKKSLNLGCLFPRTHGISMIFRCFEPFSANLVPRSS